MSLIKDFETDFGLMIPGAYHKIVSIRGTRSEILFDVSTYLNRAAYLADKAPIITKTFAVSTPEDQSNIIAQVYSFMKKMPEYDGATDDVSGQSTLSGNVSDVFCFDGQWGSCYLLNGTVTGAVTGLFIIDDKVCRGDIKDATAKPTEHNAAPVSRFIIKSGVADNVVVLKNI